MSISVPLSAAEMDKFLRAVWEDDLPTIEHMLEGVDICIPNFDLDWEEECKLPRLCYAHGAWKCFEWATRHWADRLNDYMETSQDEIVFNNEMREMLGVMIVRAGFGDLDADMVGGIVFLRGRHMDDQSWEKVVLGSQGNPCLLRADAMRLAMKEREILNGAISGL
jgi:hypothetical protein